MAVGSSGAERGWPTGTHRHNAGQTSLEVCPEIVWLHEGVGASVKGASVKGASVKGASVKG
eukprot:363736-Chlamydomonas_euryale.AAC.16